MPGEAIAFNCVKYKKKDHIFIVSCPKLSLKRFNDLGRSLNEPSW